LGVFQTTPQANSEFRYNYGFVETTGNTVTVLVTALDETGLTVGSRATRWGDIRRVIQHHRPSAAGQHDERAAGSDGDVGPGRWWRSGRDCQPVERSVDVRDELPGRLAGGEQPGRRPELGLARRHASRRRHHCYSPRIATGGVSKTKLAASGRHQRTGPGHDGTNLTWTNAGLSLPFTGTAASSGPSFAVTNNTGNIAIQGTLCPCRASTSPGFSA